MDAADVEKAVTLDVQGKIAIITLNVEKKLNALTMQHYFRIACLLQDVAKMDDVYITILTGKGRFFSAGADISLNRTLPPNLTAHQTQQHRRQTFVANNLHITRAFYQHPKILIAALNGPAVGLSAALTAFADFIYCTPATYLLTPFSSLGLVAEGGASRAFVQRLGVAKANEALIMSRRITAGELLAVGFVNRVFDVDVSAEGGSDRFLAAVLEEVRERLGGHLNAESLLRIKELIRRPEREVLDGQNVEEVFAGLERFVSGAPVEEFRRLASGEKKHKL